MIPNLSSPEAGEINWDTPEYIVTIPTWLTHSSKYIYRFSPSRDIVEIWS